MNDIGMLIDVSHASDGSFYQVMEESRAPIIASHSCARTLCDNPRNLSDDMLLFGAYSEGFRPQTANRNAGKGANNQEGVYNGYLVPAIAQTDELENFEIGFKGSFLDRTLRLNATIYKTEITDLQISRFDPANVAFLVFIENAGDAEVEGLDFDFTWLIGDRWTLSGGMSFVDNELSRVNPQLTCSCRSIPVVSVQGIPDDSLFRLLKACLQ